ncbi:GntP family permease [Hutsoniella sourekii]|uniref:GntP family permease n=1 Tax=Hutsoniella sourekii TaxID=87650 RepID=UPI0004841DFB|nr:gluconate:H+ symporter [Hutsoniella sourekii]
MSPQIQMIFGLIIAILLFVWMLLKSKVHVFLALLITAAVAGVIGGMDPIAVVGAMKTGFGNTLGNLGILIMFGVMLGKILEISGATEQIANFLIDLFGEGREHIALIVTGFITSLAIFCVPALVMLFPIAKNIAVKKQLPLSKMVFSLAAGLLLSHTFVPPASGPIGAAGIFGANIASVMLWGSLLSLILFFVLVMYANYIGKKFNDIPSADELDIEVDTEHDLPSTFSSFFPIILPIILIIVGNVLDTNSGGFLMTTIAFLGQPVIALGVSVLVAVLLLTARMERGQVLSAFDHGLEGGVKILLMVGAGGALGNVVNESGVGTFIAESIAATNIPVILLPFIIATILRLIQGSGSVATVTAASISAPIMATLGVDPVLGTLAASAGSVFFSYFNDSYFWTIQESIGNEDVKDQIITWSVPTTIVWGIALIYVLILGSFL